MSLGDWTPAGLAARCRSIWRGLRDRDVVEAEMTEEFRHHLELRTADLVRGGLTREPAARQARLEFGHIDGHLMDARASRGLASFDQLRFSALDVRLGVTRLPLPEGERVVALTNAIITEHVRNEASLRDFMLWREEVKSVLDLSAFATMRRNWWYQGQGSSWSAWSA